MKTDIFAGYGRVRVVNRLGGVSDLIRQSNQSEFISIIAPQSSTARPFDIQPSTFSGSR